jgi:hypothetical protein
VAIFRCPETQKGARMSAYVVMALGAFVVSIIAGLSGAVATPISRRTDSQASGEEQPVKPQLPPEVIAVLQRNALLGGPGSPSDRGSVQPKSALPVR